MSVSQKVAIRNTLRQWREVQANSEGVELYRILQNNTINLIADTLPETNIDLLGIKGIGPQKVKKYGETILEIVQKAALPQKQSTIDQLDQDGFSVAEFISRINFSLAKNPIKVYGEVYDQVRVRGQAIYFKIKDTELNAILECFAWKNTFADKGAFPTEGAEVLIEGQAQLYPPTGRFSLQVRSLQLRGEGQLLQAFEKLRKELEANGMFDSSLKRKLPLLVQKIAVITATGSDAATDFKTHTGNHHMDIHFYDVRVEGVRSEAAVVAAISQINSGPQNYDCIVITRGGGSLESLQSFNSKSVVEAVRGSKYPVISAVGHERDVTLCDLAADIRVSTPTDAGKLIDSTNQQFLRDNFNIHQQINLLFSDQIRNYTDEHQRLSIHIQHQAQQIVAGIRLRLEQSGALLVRQIYQIKKFLRDPQAVIQAIRARFQYNINYQHTRINDQYKLGHQIASHQTVSRGHHELTAMQNRVRTYQNNIGQIIRAAVLAVDQQAQFIASHNPEAILRRGYALVTKDNQQISSINQVETGDSLNIRLVDGNMQVTKQ